MRDDWWHAERYGKRLAIYRYRFGFAKRQWLYRCYPRENEEALAKYIVAFQPDVVLHLLALAKQLREPDPISIQLTKTGAIKVTKEPK